MGKTSSSVKNRYNAKVYDQLPIRIPKGRKEDIANRAKEIGETVNGYVNNLIRDDLGISPDKWGGNEEMKSLAQLRRILNNNGYSLFKRDKGEDSWMIVISSINGVAAGGDYGLTLDEVREWVKDMFSNTPEGDSAAPHPGQEPPSVPKK